MSVGRLKLFGPRPGTPRSPIVFTSLPSLVKMLISCMSSSTIQIFFCGIVGVDQELVRPAGRFAQPRTARRGQERRAAATPRWCCRCGPPRTRGGGGASGRGSVARVGAPAGVGAPRLSWQAQIQGAAPGGSEISPRCDTQTLSGLSAKTPEPEPQVQPAWERSVSGSGLGQGRRSRSRPSAPAAPASTLPWPPSCGPRVAAPARSARQHSPPPRRSPAERACSDPA